MIHGKYHLGIRIFSMQGFEHRNKESKRTLRKFTNNKGNILQNNLGRLWDHFYFGSTSFTNNNN